MNYEFPSPGPIKADIRVGGGEITVDAGDHDLITVSVEPQDNSTASKEAVAQTRVELDGKQLVVHAPHVKGWAMFRFPKLNIRVAMPKDSTLLIRSASADANCTGTYAEAVAHTASGDMFLDRVLKDASVNSASGDVQVGSVGGDLRVHSASGDVNIHHVGRDVAVTSASGDVEIGAADRDVAIKTASGDVEVGVTCQGETRVHTASGDVSLGVAAGTGAWLDLGTASGKTVSDLSMGAVEIPETGATLKIKIRTASGDIILRRVARV